jgi:hypothetical protein
MFRPAAVYANAPHAGHVAHSLVGSRAAAHAPVLAPQMRCVATAGVTSLADTKLRASYDAIVVGGGACLFHTRITWTFTLYCSM